LSGPDYRILGSWLPWLIVTKQAAFVCLDLTNHSSIVMFVICVDSTFAHSWGGCHSCPHSLTLATRR